MSTTPRPNESKRGYVSRCMRFSNHRGLSPKSRAAKCHDDYEISRKAKSGSDSESPCKCGGKCGKCQGDGSKDKPTPAPSSSRLTRKSPIRHQPIGMSKRFRAVMQQFAAGTLEAAGHPVKDRQQAVAIAYAEAREARRSHKALYGERAFHAGTTEKTMATNPAVQSSAVEMLGGALRGFPDEGGRDSKKHIVKLPNGKYRLYSRKKNSRGKARNLGTFGSRAAALKHERAVEYFKRKRLSASGVTRKSGADGTSEALPHSFSSTQFDLPRDLAEDVRRQAALIPDAHLAEDGREDEPHITVLYGIHDQLPVRVRHAVQGMAPVKVKLGKLALFPAKETSAQRGGAGQYDVIHVAVESPDLHRLHKRLASALPHTSTHPVYKPHVTLAYVKAGLGQKHIGDGSHPLEGHEFIAKKLIFSSAAGKRHAVVFHQAESTPLFTRKSAPCTSPHPCSACCSCSRCRSSVCIVSYRPGSLTRKDRGPIAERALVHPNRKGDIKTDDKLMSATGILASSNRDRQGDIIECRGVQFGDHEANPIVLWDHGKRWDMPIGKTEDPKGTYTVRYLPREDIIVQTTFFADTPFSRQIYALIKGGFIRANSIAVKDLEVDPLPPDPERGHFVRRDAEGRKIPFKHILKSALAEVTWTPLPANPDAVMSLMTTGKLVVDGFSAQRLDPLIYKSFLPYVPQPRVWMNGLTLKARTADLHRSRRKRHTAP